MSGPVCLYLRLLACSDDIDLIGQARERAYGFGVRLRSRHAVEEAVMLARNPALSVEFFGELTSKYFTRFPQEVESILSCWQNNGKRFARNLKVQRVLDFNCMVAHDVERCVVWYKVLHWPVQWPEPDDYEIGMEIIATLDIPQVDPHYVAARIPGLGVAS